MVSITRGLALVAAAALAVANTVNAQKWCATAPSSPGDRRADKTKLTYGTYNAEFLFLVGYGTLDCPGSDCKWTTKTAAQTHIETVAKVIKQLNVDVLQLTEIEDCAVLQKLITAIGDTTYKPYVIKGTDTSTGQNVGLITRVDPTVDLKRSETKATIPIANSTCPGTKGSGSKSVSKHFYTTIKPTGFSKAITIVGAHFLANPQANDRCWDREAQSEVIRGLMSSAVSSGNHVIVSGDLNDWSKSPFDHVKNAPISNVLGNLEGSGFHNAANYALESTRFSQWYDSNDDCTYTTKECSSLDHIIISNSLKSAVTNAKFHNDLYNASCGGYNSDHYPITVTLKPF
ncbi:hypothetical protein Poli38472_014473 [Pythium oligandrum]|uniref:Endonuclease/exonuclease/phosphatase domain-containing protein n=1 Tax=Pythium oligandrum TaxID=41045 RepID=A0A8K1CD23_PYTOL|nr:hypothetical protein Poli38472_014473 [Pythium oligandrum]|eukprot:TMW61012.1 hypothetical protein Poli38472_014473 [Pythium oligandrum]